MATKKVKDLKKGDVIRTEFGDYDNWIIVTVQRVKMLGAGSLNCQMTCTTKAGNKFEMYGKADDDIEIVER